MKRYDYDSKHRRFLHKAFLTKFSSLNVEPEKSVYYWWWAYLRKNEQYRLCCERGGKGKLSRLYKDFGDVFNVGFQTWWVSEGRGEHLFAEPLAPMHLKKIHSIEEWGEDWTEDSVMVVAVPLFGSKRLIKRSFDRLLREEHKGKPGIPSKLKSESLYPLHTKFSINALQQMMKVYELRQAEPNLTLAQIGQKLKLNLSAMPKKMDDPSAIEIKRNSMSAAVSRYLRKANAIIQNVAEGKFPCTDE